MKFASTLRNNLRLCRDRFHEYLDSQPKEIDPVLRDYHRARMATSVSGELCKLIGLLTIVIGVPFSLLTPIIIPAVIGSGCAMAALGSIATTNKRTQKLIQLQTWNQL